MQPHTPAGAENFLDRNCQVLKWSALTLVAACGMAWGQTASDIEQASRAAQRQQQLERQRQEEQFQLDRAGSAAPTQLAIPALPAPSQASGTCHPVGDIQVGGVPGYGSK